MPIVGPIVGGVFGALFFKQIFEGENSIAFWICGVVVLIILIGAQMTIKSAKEDY